MNSPDAMETRRVLTGMRNYEHALYEIYSAYSRMFPEHKSFWQDIAVEENTHSMMVDVFLSLYDDGEISFSGRTFRFADIEAELAKLRSFQDAMKTTSIRDETTVFFADKIN